MTKTILFGEGEVRQNPVLLISTNSIIPQAADDGAGDCQRAGAAVWFRLAGDDPDPETQLRHEIRKRVNKHKTDEANLILILQLAAMFDCPEIEVALPYALSEQQLSVIRTRLPRWQLSLEQERLLAKLTPVAASTNASGQR